MSEPADDEARLELPEMPPGLWEEQAGWWQEGFTEGADEEYVEQIMPLAARWLAGADRVLDVGTGEGQVARQTLAGGANSVVGIDPTRAQVVEAAVRGGGPCYALAGAAALPFAPASFDAVVACLVFEHVVAVDAALAEVARVLVPGGRFAFFLNHPLLQTPNSGWIDDHVLDPPEQYWRIGPYLREDLSLEEVEPGVRIPFVHRPLSRYLNAMAANGLLLRHMDEPSPPVGFLGRSPEYPQGADYPRLLLLVAEKVEGLGPVA
ncbi:class I SAM-dependent methyltransferase [soil metagenome]